MIRRGKRRRAPDRDQIGRSAATSILVTDAFHHASRQKPIGTRLASQHPLTDVARAQQANWKLMNGDATTILLVGGDHELVTALRRIVKPLGGDVVAAEPCDAAQLARSARAVVVDGVADEGDDLPKLAKLRGSCPGLPIIQLSQDARSETAIRAMKAGAFDYFLKPFDENRLSMAIRRAMRFGWSGGTAAAIGDHETETRSDVLVGRSPAMQELYKAIGRVAQQDMTVLIRGETGVGKELVARAIHQHGRGAAAPFVIVNCAAIPDSLFESELFGHEKGAFTGAESRRAGLFERADGVTLFLDEVADLSRAAQSKVLRILQEQSFERVGGQNRVRTDTRIVAATHGELERLVRRRQFRADLYYRLNVATIHVPPLRERAEDIPALVEHFMTRLSRELARPCQSVTRETLDALRAWRWPGNVRELEAVVRQAILRSSALTPPRERLTEREVTRELSPQTPRGRLETTVDERMRAGSRNLHDDVHDMADRYLLARVLRATEGNQSDAAEMLGISRARLRRRIRALGLSLGWRLREKASAPHCHRPARPR